MVKGEIDFYEMESFSVFLALTEAVGSLMLVLMTIWLGSYRNGFAWRANPELEFNWHPFLMSVSMIFMYGNAITIYRAFRTSSKRKLKIFHAAANGLAFILAVFGLIAVFDSHNLAVPPIANMYSLHSWLGLGSVILFVLQWVAGLITFLYPTLSPTVRAAYYPIHVYFGIAAFISAVASALLGLTEKALFSVPNYSQLPSEAVMMNVIGLTIILFGALVVHLVSNTKYKRQPLPEDEMLLTPHDRKQKCPHINEVAWFSGSTTFPQTTCANHTCKQGNIIEGKIPCCKLILKSPGEAEFDLHSLGHIPASTENKLRISSEESGECLRNSKHVENFTKCDECGAYHSCS